MVGWIQSHLEAIYGIRCDARVNDYLVDEAAAQQLGWTGRNQEELLVLEEEGALEVALYLDKTLLDRFRTFETWSGGPVLDHDLEGYCQIAEGVSHFVYLAHTADQDRSVSLLELETQAEIDKFASCTLLRWSKDPAWAEALMERLFEHVSYLPSLDAAERDRYEEANRLARLYCRRLLPHVKARRLDRFLQELRYSYRLGAQAKVRYLAKTG
jgi:hypothetical protein